MSGYGLWECCRVSVKSSCSIRRAITLKPTIVIWSLKQRFCLAVGMNVTPLSAGETAVRTSYLNDSTSKSRIITAFGTYVVQQV